MKELATAAAMTDTIATIAINTVDPLCSTFIVF
jgi:hypothetical protein